MKFSKSVMVLAALLVGSACQSTVTGAQSGASGDQTIQLPDGRSVIFHNGFTSGGFYEKGKFGIKAVALPSVVSGTVNASGFILNLTGNTTTVLAATQKIWLARQGYSMTPLFANATDGSAYGDTLAAYNAKMTFLNRNSYNLIRVGNTAAMTIPASMPAGTYGITVAPGADTFNSFRLTATSFKTAFTVTDNTQWVSVVYGGDGIAGSDAPAAIVP